MGKEANKVAPTEREAMRSHRRSSYEKRSLLLLLASLTVAVAAPHLAVEEEVSGSVSLDSVQKHCWRVLKDNRCRYVSPALIGGRNRALIGGRTCPFLLFEVQDSFGRF
ncbi:hypothetical protein MRB53_019770 [Persea americana]|uniref:Uncharacterized protein n=1 Tax=Persea americana TaxID=3435 RepID=A0ACC2KZA0_PERAE|nr:hypothetical protein MRB53_019770 [Persea americana]